MQEQHACQQVRMQCAITSVRHRSRLTRKICSRSLTVAVDVANEPNSQPHHAEATRSIHLGFSATLCLVSTPQAAL